MQDTTQSEQFYTNMTVDDQEFEICKYLVEKDDKSEIYRFTTQYNDQERELSAKLTITSVEGFDEPLDYWALSELKDMLHTEFELEIKRALDLDIWV